MKDIQLSKNFSLKESIWSEVAQQSVEPDQVQIEMHRYLAQTVQRLFRDRLNTPVKIERGQQNRAVFLALVAEGYHPSMTSDHAFGTEMDGWRWSTGAWDISFPLLKESILNIFKSAYQYLTYNEDVEKRIGQLIVYPQMNIIHISNSRELVFSKGIAEYLDKIKRHHRYLTSIDGDFIPYK